MDTEKDLERSSFHSSPPNHTATITEPPSSNAFSPPSTSEPTGPPQQLTATTIQFAGRVGGNQEFTASPADPGYEALLKRQPDAAPITDLRDWVHLKGFWEGDLWKQSMVECWGTAMLVFTTGMAASQTVSVAPPAGPLCGALVNTVGLTLFIYAFAPASGGHLNPTITVATLFARLATFSRAVLYVCAQAIGGLIGGFFLRIGLGEEAYFATGVIPGCSSDPQYISVGQMFMFEWMYCVIAMFLAFGLGLDPRQGSALGPSLSPVLIGLSLGLEGFASSFAKQGYYGAAINPARCFGLMAADSTKVNRLERNYIHWLAMFAAAVVHGTFYSIAPPWRKVKRG